MHPTACRSAEIEQLFDAIQNVREKAAAFQTNFFASRAQAEHWAERGVLAWLDAEECVLIRRAGAGVQHLYHVAAHCEAISNALATFNTGDDVASDLVGMPAEIDPVARAYEAAGFEERATLLRMVRTGAFVSGIEADAPIAGVADAAAIHGFFLQLLDRFVDQMPELEEIERAAARQNILVVRRGDAIAGALWFERTGVRATLRYWYVSPGSRDQGIGARLMKGFFEACRDARRILLWVESGNARSIAKYRHYGFEMDRLADRIMIRRGSR